MTFTVADVLGLGGVVLILGAYCALQIGRIDPTRPAYSALNAAGAALIVVSLFAAFNLAAFAIESAWLAISLFGLIRALRRR